MSRLSAVALLLLAQVICSGCRQSVSTASPDSSVNHLVTDVDRRTDPGYRPVSVSLPVLRSTGKQWRITGDDRPLARWLGQTIVAEGRMVLDDSTPYRSRFWLVRDHIGCLDPTHQDEVVGAIDVRLAGGHSIQVTDALIRVEGVLRLEEQRGNPPQLILHATAVESLPKPGEWLLPRLQ
ncbi:MAG: hypothetical protein HUU55_15790 [Myxococcales bacterium]|nr:hypothetical protein [Myxococcales bacterium]